MITFEFDKEDERLEIHGNREGLLYLANILTSMAEKKSSDHAHLMTIDWGGNLSNERQCMSNMLINHVKVYVWPNQ